MYCNEMYSTMFQTFNNVRKNTCIMYVLKAKEEVFSKFISH